MRLDTTSIALTQGTAHNISVLNEKILDPESENLKLKNDLTSLREEMKKRGKVDDT